MPDLNVIAANLARLRAEKDLSKVQLAEKAGISRVALGRIEQGEAIPQSKTLSRLARALGVPIKALVSRVDLVTNVRFRAGKRVNSREQILAEVSSWLAAYRWLESELGELKPFRLADLVGKFKNPIEAAKEARFRLDLCPDESVRDICGLLEKSGVKIFLLSRNTDAFFGLSVAPGDGGPAVVVNTWSRISVERWIFTAAHELGHILLHKDAFDCSHEEENVYDEKEADKFASYFLMPEDNFHEEWKATYGLPLLDRVLKVKRIYGVSYKTVLYRLTESGSEERNIWAIFNAQYKHKFGKALTKVDEPERLSGGEFRWKWQRAGEPDSLSESGFLQDRLYCLVRVAVEKGKITLGRASEILRISRTDMRALAVSWVK